MKFRQPSASQSKSTQTRPSSLGSRKVREPLDPCCLRFSRLVVEKTPHQRSKSSTFVVARNIQLLLLGGRAVALPRHSARSIAHPRVLVLIQPCGRSTCRGRRSRPYEAATDRGAGAGGRRGAGYAGTSSSTEASVGGVSPPTPTLRDASGHYEPAKQQPDWP